MGAVLDMVTDRFSTAGLCTILAIFYQKYAIFFIACVSLDICSHYAQMNAYVLFSLAALFFNVCTNSLLCRSLLKGSDSHKKVDAKAGLLHLYYTNRNVLGLVCLSAELVYVFLYIMHFPQFNGPLLTTYHGYDIHAIHIGLFASLPLWALKQYLNLKQLFSAMLSMDAAPAGAAAVTVSASFSVPEAAAVATEAPAATATVSEESSTTAAAPVRRRSVSRTRTPTRSRAVKAE